MTNLVAEQEHCLGQRQLHEEVFVEPNGTTVRSRRALVFAEQLGKLTDLEGQRVQPYGSKEGNIEQHCRLQLGKPLLDLGLHLGSVQHYTTP